ncbi:cellulose binding domain-containing protein [Streptomyces griseofuscus]|uniref:glycoside hydrolase family 18 protein n=1 Tax=Streptomyces griseofuscus TaxID=146922 RepID=UPI0036B28988
MSTHRRRISTRNKVISGLVAAGAIGGGALAFTGSAHAAGVGAVYTKTSHWSTGYVGQYVISNDTGQTEKDWTLTFDLPAGAKIDTLWNGTSTVTGSHVSVKPADWQTKGLAPGKSVTVGFVVDGSGDPTGCHINDNACSADGSSTPAPSGRPTGSQSPDPTPSGSSSQSPDPTPSGSSSQSTGPGPFPSQSTGSGTTHTAGFAPYVDLTLTPEFDLAGAAAKSGVKDYNLAFITDGGSCTPKWGAVTDLSDDTMAKRIAAVRTAGGDVRASFGGAINNELATTCSSVDALVGAYSKVIDTYKLTKVDFDIEGTTLGNTAANTLRAKAIAQLQARYPGLDVSFTLPVMPEGLTQEGINILTDAKANGAHVDTVNIMTMDYGNDWSGDMGTYAEQAATATQAQIKSALGLSDSAAWQALAVTPMIGVNDVTSETFKVDDAAQLLDFAKSKGLAWISMWSANRDKPCPGGPMSSTDNNCSSIAQDDFAFSKTFGAYKK